MENPIKKMENQKLPDLYGIFTDAVVHVLCFR